MALQRGTVMDFSISASRSPKVVQIWKTGPTGSCRGKSLFSFFIATAEAFSDVLIDSPRNAQYSVTNTIGQLVGNMQEKNERNSTI
jgi:hypothetical protein